MHGDCRGRMETVGQGREVSDFHEMVVVGLGEAAKFRVYNEGGTNRSGWVVCEKEREREESRVTTRFWPSNWNDEFRAN